MATDSHTYYTGGVPEFVLLHVLELVSGGELFDTYYLLTTYYLLFTTTYYLLLTTTYYFLLSV